MAKNLVYRDVAEDFAREVVSVLGDRASTVVLFGSVARQSARKQSDIDVLLVHTERGLGNLVFDIAYDTMERVGFSVFISVVCFSRAEFRELLNIGSPFMRNVIRDGVVLYDDGTFERIRREVLSSC